MDKKFVNVAVSVVLIEQIVIRLSYSICSDWVQNQGNNLLVPLDKDVYDSNYKTANLYQWWHYNAWAEWSSCFQFLENCIPKILSFVFLFVT